MLSKQDSEDLTRVGPDTIMGTLMRQYWIPAAKSEELKPDGDPVRLLLLGEKLIAFRDTSGKVGIMDHRCAHRCSSLFLGVNKDHGIRCPYHGWKFDVDGNCVEMPNVPADQDYKDKVKATAYKTMEMAGVVWVYMGENPAPAFPALEAAWLSQEDTRVVFAMRECNWLQAMEGDIDTSHFGFLHLGNVEADDLDPANPLRSTVINRAPEFEVHEVPWGMMAAAHRPASETETYWRFSQFVLPCWTLSPQGDFKENVEARCWVPMDDTHTMFVWLFCKRRAAPPILSKTANGAPLKGMDFIFKHLPNTTDWLGRYRLRDSELNDWGMQRSLQHDGASPSGIAHIHMQDQATTESMGPIVDHRREHLGPSDKMITKTRRFLLKTARHFSETGEAPPGVENADVFHDARGGYFTAPNYLTGIEAYTAAWTIAIRQGKLAR